MSIPPIPSGEKFLSCSANFSNSFISIPSPNFVFSPEAPEAPASPVLSPVLSPPPPPPPIKRSCIFLIVSSNLFFNSSSLIASNSLAVSPNESLSEIFVIIEKRISCKYFQIVSRVLLEISGVFHTSLKSISGKKFTFTAAASPLSFLKISAFLYKISKKRAGYTVLE